MYNGLNGKHVCNFYENNGVYTAELFEKEHIPTLFSTWDAENGRFIVGAEPNPDSIYILHWLEDRVLPPNRQGLKEVLAAHGIYEYDWRVLIRLNHGRTVEDCYSVEVEE